MDRAVCKDLGLSTEIYLYAQTWYRIDAGDEIVLNGTTIEEVRDYHRDTLILCVEEANRLEAEYLEREQKRRAREEASRAAYRKNVENIAGTIDF